MGDGVSWASALLLSTAGPRAAPPATPAARRNVRRLRVSGRLPETGWSLMRHPHWIWPGHRCTGARKIHERPSRNKTQRAGASEKPGTGAAGRIRPRRRARVALHGAKLRSRLHELLLLPPGRGGTDPLSRRGAPRGGGSGGGGQPVRRHRATRTLGRAHARRRLALERVQARVREGRALRRARGRAPRPRGPVVRGRLRLIRPAPDAATEP